MRSSTGRLEGKAALITGAGSGIGYAMTKLFAEQGAQVAAVTRTQESVNRWKDVANVLPIQADITKLEDIERMVDEAERQFKRVDILCNVAGISDLAYPLHETSDERWERVLDLDLKAPFRICRKVIAGMMVKGGGVILNIGSYAAERGNHGPSYTAAKSGLVGLTRSIAVFYASKGIRCNIIHPGRVHTGIGARSGGEYHPQGFKLFKDIVGTIPVKWDCDPGEVAATAVFLCSDESRHVNGTVMAVDGGMSAC